MMPVIKAIGLSQPRFNRIARALVVAGFLLFALRGQAQFDFSSGTDEPTFSPLETWSFADTTNWTSDDGYAPISFTNINYSNLGFDVDNSSTLVVDTNLPAWLQYNVFENDGTTNFTPGAGTVMFWFAPGSWASTNSGGTGPGVFGRLFEVGSYTPDSSVGWWSLYVDDVGANLYFSAQTNDYLSNTVTYLSAPIAWTTNYFHHVALTYCTTNTALYLDGALVTNGPGMSAFPGASALTNGFFIGSDVTGNLQAHGMFNNLATFNVPVDANTIAQIFNDQYMYYLLTPWNTAMSQILSANAPGGTLYQPNFSANSFDIIAGAGVLQYVGPTGSCVTSSNVWITNVTVNVTSQPITFNFSIAGGSPGAMYDVFATPALSLHLTNSVWTWLGQGLTCSTYSIPNLPATNNVFFILGTPQDTDGDGLTDAYELLVSHSNPNVVDTDASGMPDGWQALHFNGQVGANPLGDPDLDGLLNVQEYLYGTDPNAREGIAVWVSSPN